MEPNRGEDDPSHVWLYGKPDYSVVNLEYLKSRSKNHADGSLESIVENLVKTWEMESQHKKFTEWKTVNHEKFRVRANAGKEYDGDESVKVGSYNWLLDSCPKELYDNSKYGCEESQKMFHGAFDNGFAWEVLNVYTGPPSVGFQWRHFGRYTGSFRGKQGDGEMINMYGFAVATTDDNGKICTIQIYYKPEEFLMALEGQITIDDLEDKIAKI